MTTAATIRPLRRDELDTVVGWAAAEGWNPGRVDADAFWAQDPHGFWGAELDGQLVGSASAVAYGDSYGFWGMFIVVPEHRGEGIGSLIARTTIADLRDRLRDGAAIELDGVPQQEDYYRSLGFAYGHRNVRMRGTAVVAAPEHVVVPLASVAFDALVAYDAAVFGTLRPDFLSAWLTPPGGLAVGVLEGGRITGYGVVRHCEDGAKIGPLFADDPAVAESLYRALASHVAGSPIHLDIPETQPDAVALAARHGLTESFACARMRLGGPSATRWDRVVGVTSFELG
jgi:GNAT superfamily N-acetyltransferase